MHKEWKGRGASEGMCAGTLWFPAPELDAVLAAYRADSSDAEKEKLAKAMESVANRLNALADAARERGETEQAEVLEAHALMAADPMIREETEKRIEGGMAAPYALREATEEQAAVLAALEDDYLRERAQDVRQAARAVILEICGVRASSIPQGKIVIAGKDIEPAQLAAVPKEQLAGVILCGGTLLGHVFILSRARGIPAVSLSEQDFAELAAGTEVFVDGGKGIVVSEPTDGERKAAEAAVAAEEYSEGPAVMADGHEVMLRANIGNAEEAEDSQKKGALGVGLFRTEFLFMGRDTLPGEDEQYEAYRDAVIACGHAPCVIRTLDVGGDKPLKAFPLPKEMNPFLGVRGIRAELLHEDVLRTQLRALMRAAACGHCAIMLPMVTNASEIERVRTIAQEELARLTAEGKEAVLPNIGAMVETPAAAILSRSLAKHAGFFSIGTNDLTQYTLATDRTNEAVADIGDSLHPAVLRLIKQTIGAANQEGIPVIICGEIAGDPLAAPILASMGRVALSMGAGSLPRIRKALKNTTLREVKERMEAVLQMEDAVQVREYLANK